MSYMIGVDVGGTFTDFSVFNQETGELFNYKDSSTPADPSRAIVKGVEDVLAIKQASPEEVSYLAHGTTVGTNALIEKKGCRLGLITTKGFKDLMEIGTQRPSLSLQPSNAKALSSGSLWSQLYRHRAHPL